MQLRTQGSATSSWPILYFYWRPSMALSLPYLSLACHTLGQKHGHWFSCPFSTIPLVGICTCNTAFRLLLQAALFLYFSSEVALVSVYSSRCCLLARTDTLFHSVTGRTFLSPSAGYPLDKNYHETKIIGSQQSLPPPHSDNNPSACKIPIVFNKQEKVHDSQSRGE